MPSINTELGERALSKMQHEMDWKPLKERCLREYPSWSSRHVDRVLREYQRFLALKVATRDIYDTIVLAPVLLDAMWKQHILSTQQYYADCQLLLQANQILHYNSDASTTVSESVKDKRMELTKASLCMMFSGMYPLSSDAKGIWDYEEGEGDCRRYYSRYDNHVRGKAHSVSVLADDDLDEDEEDEVAEENTNGELTEEAAATARAEEQEEDLPLIDRDDEEETQPELFPSLRTDPSCSPQKRQTKPTTRPQNSRSDDVDLSRQLLYVYRAGKVSKLFAYPHETITTIKKKIQKKTGIAPHQQYLEWDGIELDEDRSIHHYGIPTDATLALTKIRSHGRQRPIDTEVLKEQHDILTDEQIQPETDTRRTRGQDERDDPEITHSRRQRQGQRGRSASGSPTRRRSRPMASPLKSSPRPPKPPTRQQQQQLQRRQQSQKPSQPLHHEHPPPPYSPSSTAEGYSLVTEPSTCTVADDHRRRQQVLLNKLRIQSHHDHHLHVGKEDSSTFQSTILPSRPRPKVKPLSGDPLLKVFVNTIMGFTITLTAKASDTVEHLKQMIDDQEDIPLHKQILILDGVPLEDTQYLSDYTSDSSLHVLLRLQAGSSSVGSIGADSSLTSPNSTMATVPRKKLPAPAAPFVSTSNKLLVRTAAVGHVVSPTNSSPRHDQTPTSLLVENRPKWR